MTLRIALANLPFPATPLLISALVVNADGSVAGFQDEVQPDRPPLRR